MRKYEELRRIQHVAIDQVVGNPGYMLALDMGFGKTAIVLTAIRHLLDTFQVSHVLVVAPLLVAEETWPNEIESWEHTCVLDYEVVTGDAERREQRARRLAEVSITNVENLVWLTELWGDDWPYDMVVIDESSRFKNPKKKTNPSKKVVEKVMMDTLASLPADMDDLAKEREVARALKKIERNLTRFGALCSVRGYIDRIVTLTGTPAPQGLLDLWSQYYLLDRGERLGSTYHAYTGRWFRRGDDGFKYIPKDFAFDQITNRIKDVTLSLKTEDYVDMPPVMHNVISVKLPPKVMKAYREFVRTLNWDEHDIEAVNNGVLTQKCLQAANGSLYREDGSTVEIHDLKLEALDRVIEEANGAPVLVAYSYRFDLDKLRKRYPQAEVVGEVAEVEKRWNRGEIPILLAHPASAGHGMNLQYGGCIAVWYGLNWSLELYQQFNKRLVRPGQTKPVVIHHIVSEGTVDERVMSVLPEKEATQDAILEATKYVDE